jgi:hypothetical protein
MDRAVADNKQHLQQTDRNVLRGIRTHNPSKGSPQTYALDREAIGLLSKFSCSKIIWWTVPTVKLLLMHFYS